MRDLEVYLGIISVDANLTIVDMTDPTPDQSLEDWVNSIPYRGQWVIPGVLARVIARARAEGRGVEIEAREKGK